MIRIFLIHSLVLFSALTSIVKAQEISVNARIDSAVILIGKQSNVTIEVRKKKNVNVDFPVFSDSLVNGVEIIDQSKLDTVNIDENYDILEKNIVVTAWDSGYYFIPPFAIPFEIDGNYDTIESRPLAISVQTFEVDTTKGVFDIKPPMEAPITFSELLPWILYGVLGLAAVIGILILIRLYQRKPVIPKMAPPKPKEPAHIIAKRELDRIKSEKLWQKDQEKKYYSELTETLRRYIEERFRIKAMEQTSGEILYSIRKEAQLDKPVVENLEQILSTADMVKFAKMKPLPDENNLSMMNAYFFIDKTKPVEIISEEDKAKEEEKVKNKVEETTETTKKKEG